MAYPDIEQIREALAGTGVTMLELSGTLGHVRIVTAASPSESYATAPGAGRFLHRHPLCRDALVSEGAVVEKGAVIGLLQVGVLLIPVVAPCDGRVVGHLVAEGAIAGYGTRLVALTAGAAS